MKKLLLFLLLGLSITLKAQDGLIPQYFGNTKLFTSSTGNIEGIFSVRIAMPGPDPTLGIGDISVINGSAANLYSADSMFWDVNIIPNGAGDVSVSIPSRSSNTLTQTINTDWKFITQSSTSDIYYEFRELVGDNNTSILITDPGINDLSNNSRTLSLINSPAMTQLQTLSDVNVDQMALRCSTTSAVSIGSTGSSFLSRTSGFSVVFGIRSADGQGAGWAICGNRDATNIGLIIDVTSAGNLEIKYQGFVWLSTSSVFVNNTTGLHYFSVDFDFPHSTLTVYKDNSTVPGSFTSGNISSTNPSSFACTQNFYIGTYNNNGSAFSNPIQNQITYFAITTLQSSGQRSSLYTYLTTREANIKLVATISDASFLKYPHDLLISDDKRYLYVSGKGDDVLTSIDGSLGIIDVTTPSSPVIAGGYSGHSDQVDGETVLILNPWRVMHFVNGSAMMFGVSYPQRTNLLSTVSHAGTVINGAVRIGNYVFGANKGGYINVFDVTNPDSFTLVGSYNSSGDGLGGCHDIDVTDDGQYIIVANRITGSADVGIYQVFSGGSFIPIASWALKGSLISGTVTDTNRARILRGQNAVIASASPLSYTIDISNLTSPSLGGTFDNTTFSSGLAVYRHRYDVVTWQVGIRLLDTSNINSLVQKAGYYNATTFTTGNASFHDCITWEKNGINYLAVAAQSSQRVAIFKINRL